MRFKYTLADFRKHAAVQSPRKLYAYAILIGAMSGAVGLLFSFLLAHVEHWTFLSWVGFDPGSATGEYHVDGRPAPVVFRPWAFFLLPVTGAFVCGLLVQLLAPEARGAGIDATIRSFHEEEGRAKTRTPFVKMFATIAILASGGSAGKEGPLSQIGSAIGALVGRLMGLGPKARRALFLAGMAGALGAIFRAPLGAAMTSVEVLYKEDFESESLIPSIIASITGYFVFTSVRGFDHIFNLPPYAFANWAEMFFYIILGLLCFGLGFLFVRTYEAMGRFFERLPAPFFVRVTLGGLGVSLVALLCFESIGTGFGFLQKLMHGSDIQSNSLLGQLILQRHGEDGLLRVLLFLGSIVLLKIIATSFTIGSGGSGGVFGPSLFLGGVLGAMVGIAAHKLFPSVASSYIPYIVVGMGGFFAGVANTPIASVIMVCELTGSYELLAPLMMVAIIALVFSHRFNIYKEQKRNKFESPAHEWEMTNDFLTNVSIAESLDKLKTACVLPERTKAARLYAIADKKQQTDFVIRNKEYKYVGIFSLRHLTPMQKRKLEDHPGVIGDLAKTNVPALHAEDSLSDGLDLLINYDVDKVAVLDDEDRVLGYVTFRDILMAYRQKVIRHSST